MRSMHPIRVYERQGADLNVTEDGLRSPHGPSHRLALTVGKCSGRDQSGTNFPNCVSKPTMGFEPMTPALRERSRGRQRVHGRASPGTIALQVGSFVDPPRVRPYTAVVILMYPFGTSRKRRREER